MKQNGQLEHGDVLEGVLRFPIARTRRNPDTGEALETYYRYTFVPTGESAKAKLPPGVNKVTERSRDLVGHSAIAMFVKKGEDRPDGTGKVERDALSLQGSEAITDSNKVVETVKAQSTIKEALDALASL